MPAPFPAAPSAPAQLVQLARAVLLGASLAGCAALPPPGPDFASFVVLGEHGAAVARVLIAAPACPAIEVDGRSAPMRLRAGAATEARRPGAPAPEDARPAAFPVLSCESALAPGAASVSVLGRALPLPPAEARRIVVIGDTGCRLKKKDAAYQACNDAEAYPFAAVAAAAARWKPDLVVHVGDYHYRENRCPDEQPGCAGSPWGYGWDAWRADFFDPGAALLRAAPWVMARGNHESCQRAGQGFWRFLDPRPLLAGRDCRDAGDDGVGDHSDPYAVPLGGEAQLLVLDTSATSWRGFRADAPALARYRADYRLLEALSQGAAYNIGVNHQPILGFGALRDAAGAVSLYGGDAGLQQAFGALNPLLLPPRINVMLSGHTHLWQQVSFSSPHPSQFIAGFSGTAEDIVPLPAALPQGATPAPGAVVAHFSSWTDGFGFMTMERRGGADWDVTVWDRHGRARNTCRLSGSASLCAEAQVR
ncbi:metallophosphoesterase [Janthinobacterium sp.]|uniref:metallophosphoesterase family protein n=1 Tax=Janthinobacterium sp. TaxID=1871054 RepID=UPI00293D84D1|nr:metallophosphoesterase [Janthinobacterium sp.]